MDVLPVGEHGVAGRLRETERGHRTRKYAHPADGQPGSVTNGQYGAMPQKACVQAEAPYALPARMETQTLSPETGPSIV